MSATTPNTVQSDAQMAERLKKAIDRNNTTNNRAIRIQAEADMAEKAAKAEAVDAEKLFDVKSLQELREKAGKTYDEDIAKLDELERKVAEREAAVLAAEKILAEASVQ